MIAMEEFLRKNGMKSKPVILGVVLGVKLNTVIVVVLAVEIKISFKHVYENLGVKIAKIAMEHFHTKQMHLSLLPYLSSFIFSTKGIKYLKFWAESI